MFYFIFPYFLFLSFLYLHLFSVSAARVQTPSARGSACSPHAFRRTASRRGDHVASGRLRCPSHSCSKARQPANLTLTSPDMKELLRSTDPTILAFASALLPH